MLILAAKIALAIIGLLLTALGALAAVMPTFGGSRSQVGPAVCAVLGIALVVTGVVL